MPAPWMKTTTGRPGSNGRPPVDAKTLRPSTARSMVGSGLSRRPQRLAEIVDEVGCVFEPDRQADHLFADAGRGQGLGIHLLMRRACGMDDQGLRIAPTGQMREHAQPLDEAPAGAAAALDPDTPNPE